MKKTWKSLGAIFTFTAILLTLTACGNAPTEQKPSEQKPAEDAPTAASYTFSMGTIDNDEHASTQAAKKLVELLNAKAPGKFNITVYPNGTLGNASEMVEAVQMGNIDIATPTASFVANYVPNLGVLDLPYLFANEAQADAVLDGEVGQELGGEINNAGMKFLAYWEVGFRCLANSKRAINHVDDMAGLRLRIMSSEVHEALFSALGCDPVPMGLSDALVANQQGTIDGMDNPLTGLYTTSVYEFDKYIAVTNHVYTVQSVIMSQKAWNSMTEEDQQIFMEAVQEATAFERETNRSQGQEAANKLIEKGCEISYPDVSGFAEKMNAVYEQYPQFSDLLSRIKASAETVQ